MTRSFRCAECKRLVPNIHERLEERREFRRVSDQGRHRVEKVRDVCTTCYPKRAPADRQEAML